jgi:hypothetical protein
MPRLQRQSVLRSPTCRAEAAKNGRISHCLGKQGREFSALQTVWRRGRDSIAEFSLSRCEHLHFHDNTLYCSGLQATSIFAYSFYSFPYSLQFPRKWYQWYQCPGRLISTPIRHIFVRDHHTGSDSHLRKGRREGRTQNTLNKVVNIRQAKETRKRKDEKRKKEKGEAVQERDS